MWLFQNKFLRTHIPAVDRALLALGKQLANAFSTAPCGTWAQIAAAPFNGSAFNHNNGAYVGP